MAEPRDSKGSNVNKLFLLLKQKFMFFNLKKFIKFKENASNIQQTEIYEVNTKVYFIINIEYFNYIHIFKKLKL